jgi:NitT/TauT family transport system permease protein
MSAIDVRGSAAAAPRLRFPALDRTTLGVVATHVVLVVASLTLWQQAAARGWINGHLFGSPAGLWTAAARMRADGSLLSDTALTGGETVAGFVLGTVIGTFVGLALWASRFAARVVDPIAVAFNAVPKIALGPMIIIWLGAGVGSKVALAFVSTAVVALLAAYAATREIDPDLLTLFRCMGASRVQTFVKLVVPAAQPLIFGAMRINVGFALVGAVVGEFISSQAGLGHDVFVAGNLFDLNTVWVGILALSAIAAVMYGAIGVLERFMLGDRR